MISFAIATRRDVVVERSAGKYSRCVCVWQNEMQRERNIEISSDYSAALPAQEQPNETGTILCKLSFYIYST